LAFAELDAGIGGGMSKYPTANGTGHRSNHLLGTEVVSDCRS